MIATLDQGQAHIVRGQPAGPGAARSARGRRRRPCRAAAAPARRTGSAQAARDGGDHPRSAAGRSASAPRHRPRECARHHRASARACMRRGHAAHIRSSVKSAAAAIPTSALIRSGSGDGDQRHDPGAHARSDQHLRTEGEPVENAGACHRASRRSSDPRTAPTSRRGRDSRSAGRPDRVWPRSRRARLPWCRSCRSGSRRGRPGRASAESPWPTAGGRRLSRRRRVLECRLRGRPRLHVGSWVGTGLHERARPGGGPGPCLAAAGGPRKGGR